LEIHGAGFCRSIAKDLLEAGCELVAKAKWELNICSSTTLKAFVRKDSSTNGTVPNRLMSGFLLMKHPYMLQLLANPNPCSCLMLQPVSDVYNSWTGLRNHSVS
jgi:hypothetical protein